MVWGMGPAHQVSCDEEMSWQVAELLQSRHLHTIKVSQY